MTNSERRISHLSKVIDPPGEALPDSEILCSFAKAMGFAGFDYKSAAEIFEENAALTKGTNIDIGGLTYSKLKEGSIQGPAPENSIHGTSRLSADHLFYTPSQNAKFLLR